jgi:hypothetical protein
LRKPEGILMDVPVMVGNFTYPVDFIILDMSDKSEAIILGRPFLATAGALIDVQGAKLTLKFGKKEVVFDMKHATHIPHVVSDCMKIDSISSYVSDLHPNVNVEPVMNHSESINLMSIILICIKLPIIRNTWKS